MIFLPPVRQNPRPGEDTAMAHVAKTGLEVQQGSFPQATLRDKLEAIPLELLEAKERLNYDPRRLGNVDVEQGPEQALEEVLQGEADAGQPGVPHELQVQQPVPPKSRKAPLTPRAPPEIIAGKGTL